MIDPRFTEGRTKTQGGGDRSEAAQPGGQGRARPGRRLSGRARVSGRTAVSAFPSAGPHGFRPACDPCLGVRAGLCWEQTRGAAMAA